MKLAGVMGWPVSHSLSPRVHGFWLREHGIDGAYVPLAVMPEDAQDVLRMLPKMGFAGVNLTVPHKEIILPVLDEMDAVAGRIGAVNTVVMLGGALIGTNTDAYGFTQNLRDYFPARNWKRALVLGAGGAARAVAVALIDMGVEQIFICNRNSERAGILCDMHPSLSPLGWDEKDAALGICDLLVNATTLGMRGQPELAIDLSAMLADAVVTDIVYTPRETGLLRAAKARGLAVVDGLGMLLHQAVPGFEAWFGVRPRVTPELRALCEGALP